MGTDPTQPSQPQAVMPQPVPLTFNLRGAVTAGNSPLTVLEVYSPTGVAVYFLERETALSLSSALKRQAQSGPKLVTPPSGPVTP